jgi:hypothetical protein
VSLPERTAEPPPEDHLNFTREATPGGGETRRCA